ncbi:hypothetical protein LINPERHAP2_LOCUS16955 [Linum perenne]
MSPDSSTISPLSTSHPSSATIRSAAMEIRFTRSSTAASPPLRFILPRRIFTSLPLRAEDEGYNQLDRASLPDLRRRRRRR